MHIKIEAYDRIGLFNHQDDYKFLYYGGVHFSERSPRWSFYSGGRFIEVVVPLRMFAPFSTKDPSPLHTSVLHSVSGRYETECFLSACSIHST